MKDTAHSYVFYFFVKKAVLLEFIKVKNLAARAGAARRVHTRGTESGLAGCVTHNQ